MKTFEHHPDCHRQMNNAQRRDRVCSERGCPDSSWGKWYRKAGSLWVEKDRPFTDKVDAKVDAKLHPDQQSNHQAGIAVDLPAPNYAIDPWAGFDIPTPPAVPRTAIPENYYTPHPLIGDPNPMPESKSASQKLDLAMTPYSEFGSGVVTITKSRLADLLNQFEADLRAQLRDEAKEAAYAFSRRDKALNLAAGIPGTPDVLALARQFEAYLAGEETTENETPEEIAARNLASDDKIGGKA